MTNKFKFALTFAFVMAAAALPAWAGVSQGPPAVVPEPSTIIMAVSGIGGIGVLRRLRNR